MAKKVKDCLHVKDGKDGTVKKRKGEEKETAVEVTK